jgi:Cu-Zn family superoxide dismutase
MVAFLVAGCGQAQQTSRGRGKGAKMGASKCPMHETVRDGAASPMAHCKGGTCPMHGKMMAGKMSGKGRMHGKMDGKGKMQGGMCPMHGRMAGKMSGKGKMAGKGKMQGGTCPMHGKMMAGKMSGKGRMHGKMDGKGKMHGKMSGKGRMHGKMPMCRRVTEAVALIRPTEGNEVRGAVRFTQQTDGTVRIVADVEGLEPDSVHGLHIHEFGDLRAADATSAGGHYAPAGHPHAGPTAPKHHAGDFGNLAADGDGAARKEMTVDFVSLVCPMHNPILGRAVVIHAGEDDLHTQPTGAAGARIGVGVIAIANPEFGTNE